MSSKKKTRKNGTAPSPVPETTAAAPVPQEAPAPAVFSVSAPVQAAQPSARQMWGTLALTAAFFLVTCFITNSTLKPLAVGMAILAAASCLIRLSSVRDRLSLPMAAVSAWILMNGISTFYAVSGKFALREFLRLFVSFCGFLVILAWSPKGRDKGRPAASVLSGAAALASLFSIDMLSTHWLSGPLLGLLGQFSSDYLYAANNAVEAGVRMNSLYENPNVFAGVAGIGVLLALELAVTSEKGKARFFHLACLFLNALAFLLAFSMGASGMIVLAFLVLLLLERKERKASLLILMLETFVLALAGAFPIFLTAFRQWNGFQPVPLLCAVGGGAALCLLDHFAGQKVSESLSRRDGKFLSILTVLTLVLLAAFAAAAMNLAGPADLSAGEALRRAEYPEPGAYTLEVQATRDLQVVIESQDQQETMMHTGTVLYSGPAQGAEFSVPEGSLVTYFTFRAAEDLTLDSVSLVGAGTSTALKLDYKLLPGFIANRLQGLFANENAIQRTVFFADGMKIFRRSPVFGLGLGAFENSIPGVQSFFYETRYAHNHYVETLVSTGVVGLVLFLGMLALCAAAVLKNRFRSKDPNSLIPALGAILLFMACHGAMEVVFSFYSYLPYALGVLGLICLCCGGELPLPEWKEDVKSWCVVGLCGLIAVYTVLVGLNMQALRIAQNNTEGDPYRSLALAEKLDFFEKWDYMTSYIYMAQGVDRETQWEVYSTANEYAGRLSQVDSNSIPPYLAQYYFSTEQPEEAIAALKKYVDYIPANPEAWQTSFDILAIWGSQYPQCRDAAAEIYEALQSWNDQNMGNISLTDANRQYLDSILG